jgi:CubicO group peptidase (beta-lactamase class C family)
MMSTMKRFLSLLLCLAPLWAAPPDARKAGMDPARLALIPVRMQAAVDRGRISGAVTLVARRGVIASLDAVGYLDLENKRPMRTDSIFQIMSMTKPVTAVAAMMLVEEGRLALDDSLDKYLPEFRPVRTERRPPTVRDLMTHTSGVTAPRSVNIMSTMDMTLADAVTLYAQTPLEFEPGSRWAYSNPGIAVLGRIVEVVSRQPYERFVEERILQPLGMTDTFFFPPPGKTSRIALVYRNEDGKLRRGGPELLGGQPDLYRKGAKYPCPECGLFSTAHDVFAFHQMMLNGGSYGGRRLLSRASVEVMTVVHTGDLKAGFTPGLGWGLGFGVVRDPAGMTELLSLGSYGHGGAFGTEAFVDPMKDLIRILLLAREGNIGIDERHQFFAIAGAAAE